MPTRCRLTSQPDFGLRWKTHRDHTDSLHRADDFAESGDVARNALPRATCDCVPPRINAWECVTARTRKERTRSKPRFSSFRRLNRDMTPKLVADRWRRTTAIAPLNAGRTRTWYPTATAWKQEISKRKDRALCLSTHYLFHDASGSSYQLHCRILRFRFLGWSEIACEGSGQGPGSTGGARSTAG